jgi:hypothetical protein
MSKFRRNLPFSLGFRAALGIILIVLAAFYSERANRAMYNPFAHAAYEPVFITAKLVAWLVVVWWWWQLVRDYRKKPDSSAR